MLLVVAAAAGLMAQAPQDLKTWVENGFDPGNPNAYAVTGSVELSRAEAWEAVERQIDVERRDRLESVAADECQNVAPAWLPSFFQDKAVDAWLSEQMRQTDPRVLDSNLVIRPVDDVYQSYQAHVLVDLAGAKNARLDRLRRRLAVEEEKFLAKIGGTLGLWGVLAVIILWIDRLTRGYMTGRLYTLGALLGIGGPIVLLLA